LSNPAITWTFTTGENTPPTVVITPVKVDAASALITLTFSEPVDSVTDKHVIINEKPIPVGQFTKTGDKVFTYQKNDLASESTNIIVVENGAFVDKPISCSANKVTETKDSIKVGDLSVPLASGSPKSAPDYNGLKLIITFTDNVTPAATGNIVIYNTATDSVVETIAANSKDLTASVGKTVYTFSPKKVKFGQYYIKIDAGAFVDSTAAPAGQACPGISAKTDWPLAIVDPEFVNCYNIIAPLRAAINVPVKTDVVIDFCQERIAAGTEKVTIGDQSVTRVLGVTYFEYAVTKDMISGNKLTIPVSGLKENTTYSIIIPQGAVLDEAGNTFIGITDANRWIFTTGDFTDPGVTVAAVTVMNDGTGAPVSITSTEAGTVYLAKDEVTAKPADLLAAIALKKAVAAPVITGNVAVTVSVQGLLPGTYKAYGFDASGRMGTAANVVTVTAPVVIPLSTIKQIQGQVAASPLAGQKVRTRGVVTAKVSNGFYMQDANASWSGILVITTQSVSVNSSVELIGTVAEVDGQTTIGSLEGNISFIAPVITTKALTVAPSAVVEEMNEGVLLTVTGRVATSGSVTADWTISSVAGKNYTINNAIVGSYATKKDYKYAVTGIGIQSGTNYKVLATEIKDMSTINSIDDLSNSVKVYPNPFDKFITLSVSNDVVITKVVITNIAGQLVKEVINPNNTIPTSELRSGVYFISLHTVDGIAKTERIIKR
jgi:hypothetical protein